jgi:peptidoglycan-associated lipoprotein
MAESDIALEEETLRSFFDNDLEEFVASVDYKDGGKQAARLAADADNSEFAWVQGNDQAAGAFKTVFFDFDRSSVRPDQKNIVETDIQAARKVLAEARKNGAEPTIVIEGHACHSAGSSAYNLAISERRAKAISDWFVSEGVARDNIKIVGRGKEVPAVVDGKPVTGGREEQWPNRRVEVHVINS